MDKDYEAFVCKRERAKSDHERWASFEYKLRYLLCDLNDETDREDSFLLDDVKHTVLVFAMKDKFKGMHETFLNLMKNNFYDAIHRLEEKHPDIQSRTCYIKSFMEDFYINDYQNEMEQQEVELS